MHLIIYDEFNDKLNNIYYTIIKRKWNNSKLIKISESIASGYK